MRGGARLADHLDWHLVFAGLKFAVIMCRLARLMAAAGMIEADSDYDRTNTAAQMLEGLTEDLL